jgi:hypothetical protein
MTGLIKGPLNGARAHNRNVATAPAALQLFRARRPPLGGLAAFFAHPALIALAIATS